MDQEKVVTKAYTLYPVQQYIVEQVARELFDGNDSMAARFIINEWARKNWNGESETELTPIEKAAQR